MRYPLFARLATGAALGLALASAGSLSAQWLNAQELAPTSAEHVAQAERFAPFDVRSTHVARLDVDVSLAASDTLELNLPGDRTLFAVAESIQTTLSGRIIWQGRVDGQPASYVRIVRDAGGIRGRVRLPGENRVFHLIPRLTAVHEDVFEAPETLIVEVDSAPPFEANDSPANFSNPALPPGLAVPAGKMTSVDILVAFTADAGVSDMTLEAEDLIAEANQAMANSGVSLRWRLAGTIGTSYIQSATIPAFVEDLRRLVNPADGVLDEVVVERDRVRADAVVLMWDPLESTCRHASLSIL